MQDEKLMFSIIRASFNQRRKTLANALDHCTQIGLEKERLQECIQKMNLPAAVRGEELTLEQFGMLTDLLDQHMHADHISLE